MDNEEVVVMEFGMGCSSCTDAAGDFSSLKNQYNISHPGKVKFFYMDYWDGHGCAEVNYMVNSYNLDAGFFNTAADLSYYTPASPMTYVVIVAGSAHQVIYNVKKYIYERPDSTIIKNTIDAFFNTIGVREIARDKNEIKIYPNPASGEIFIESVFTLSSPGTRINIYDTQARLIKEIKFSETTGSKNGIILHVADLPSGNYVFELINNGQKLTAPFIIKN